MGRGLAPRGVGEARGAEPTSGLCDKWAEPVRVPLAGAYSVHAGWGAIAKKGVAAPLGKPQREGLNPASLKAGGPVGMMGLGELGNPRRPGGWWAPTSGLWAGAPVRTPT